MQPWWVGLVSRQADFNYETWVSKSQVKKFQIERRPTFKGNRSSIQYVYHNNMYFKSVKSHRQMHILNQLATVQPWDGKEAPLTN